MAAAIAKRISVGWLYVRDLARSVTFELWDFETGNALGEYERREDALAVVRENGRAHGPSAVQGIALLACDTRGESRLVAQGEKLLQLVLHGSAAN